MFFIFVLVPARAKIYAQGTAGTKDSLTRTSSLSDTLFISGIDSILHSHNLSIENVRIIIDTNPAYPIREYMINKQQKKKWGYLIIKYLQILTERVSGLEGATTCVISARGTLCSLDSSSSTRDFSFYRLRKFNPLMIDYERKSFQQDKSFWDTTAKPILVTLGAVAVIALFFLVRG